MKNTLDVVLILALPASGKSEVRKFLRSLDPVTLRDEFHLGHTVELDDYPCVAFMRAIDNALAEMGRPRLFFQADDKPLIDPRDWGTLIYLLNDNFSRLGKALSQYDTHNPVESLFVRIDCAAAEAGLKPRLLSALGSYPIAQLKKVVLDKTGQTISGMSEKILVDINREIKKPLDDATVFIECARGGPANATMPLAPPMGYQHSLSLLSPEILQKASILYVMVDPEQSRAKNEARKPPPGFTGDTGVFHFVPDDVMDHDYGCDDMGYMIKISGHQGVVMVRSTDGHIHYLPTAVLDNTGDLTTFAQKGKPADWPEDAKAKLSTALRAAFDHLIARQNRR